MIKGNLFGIRLANGLIQRPLSQYISPRHLPDEVMVEVSHPCYIGECAICKANTGKHISKNLPESHPGSQINVAICFVAHFFEKAELKKTALVCDKCALALPEVNGYWGVEK